MGNCHCAEAPEVADEAVQPVRKVGITQFQFMYCIGRGGFGKVWKVQYKRDNSFYAMKEMQKARILSRRSLNSVMSER